MPRASASSHRCLPAIAELRRSARRSEPNVRLYTDVPATVRNCPVSVYSPPDLVDQGDDDAECFPRTLHAKAYVFRPRVGNAALAWLGSVNFTPQAMTKSVSKGGNFELMIRTRLAKDEADDLEFDLGRLFKRCEGSVSPVSRHNSHPPKAISTILACELKGTPGLLHAHLRDPATRRCCP